MTRAFVIPTLFNTIAGVWYWTFMSSLNATETHYQIHVFCIIARTFYGSILSLPLSGVMEIVINRLMVWVMVFMLLMDATQLVIIITNFYSYIISDALATLFSVVFIFLNLFYIGECYNVSSKGNIEKRYCINKQDYTIRQDIDNGVYNSFKTKYDEPSQNIKRRNLNVKNLNF
tara:strand:- start:2243 stop:2764 length:522 start_codon:yes stop_codon:yes gene_type:complete